MSPALPTGTDHLVRDILANRPGRPLVIELVEEDLVPFLKTRTPAVRLATAWGMWDFARDTIRRNLAEQHPDWPEETLQRETARRMSYAT